MCRPYVGLRVRLAAGVRGNGVSGEKGPGTIRASSDLSLHIFPHCRTPNSQSGRGRNRGLSRFHSSHCGHTLQDISRSDLSSDGYLLLFLPAGDAEWISKNGEVCHVRWDEASRFDYSVRAR